MPVLCGPPRFVNRFATHGRRTLRGSWSLFRGAVPVTTQPSSRSAPCVAGFPNAEALQKDGRYLAGYEVHSHGSCEGRECGHDG